MALIKSISGIRGTIGGIPNNNLTPIDIVKFTSAYGMWIQQNNGKTNGKIIVGRDARISGKMVENIVVSTLISQGFDVLNIGLTTTPTTEIAVTEEQADGGIIITASHNPKHWNALKLLNSKGEFLTAEDGKQILEIAEKENFLYSDVDNIGKIYNIENYEDIHIEKITKDKLVNVEKIKESKFKIAIDCVNSTGGIVIPKLLKNLGVNDIVELYCLPDGEFPHNPEPLPENLTEIAKVVKEQKCDIGFVVDPDVDRLAIICEDGTMFGEEYTLVSVAGYVFSKKKGNTVSNLSSTRALRDIAEKYGNEYHSSAVGEVNVVAKMKEINAVIGGEGNGGVIYPGLHYGRDALVGIALFLSLLAEKKQKVSEIRKSYPNYYISKNKIELSENINIDKIFQQLENEYKDNPKHTIDGLKIEFPESKEWIHLRKSNTEPIIRIYSESENKQKAEELAKIIITKLQNIQI